MVASSISCEQVKELCLRLGKAVTCEAPICHTRCCRLRHADSDWSWSGARATNRDRVLTKESVDSLIGVRDACDSRFKRALCSVTGADLHFPANSVAQTIRIEAQSQPPLFDRSRRIAQRELRHRKLSWPGRGSGPAFAEGNRRWSRAMTKGCASKLHQPVTSCPHSFGETKRHAYPRDLLSDLRRHSISFSLRPNAQIYKTNIRSAHPLLFVCFPQLHSPPAVAIRNSTIHTSSKTLIAVSQTIYCYLII